MSPEPDPAPNAPPPPAAAAPTPASRLATIATAPLRWFFAPDVFLSYSSDDGRGYADSLRRRLRGLRFRFNAVMDTHHARLGKDLPGPVRRDARWSRLRIVIASPASLASSGVAKEVAEFNAYPDNAVLLVTFDGTRPEDADWCKEHLGGYRSVREPLGADALAHARASREVVEQILSAATFLRRNQRVALGAGLGAAFALSSALAAAYFTREASVQGELAGRAEAKAVSAAASAASANEAASAARAQARQASTVAASALAAASAAQGRQLEAQTAADASDRRARAAALAERAATLLSTSPGQSLAAAQLAVESLGVEETAAAADVLRGILAVTPPLLRDLRIPCLGNIAAIDAQEHHVAVGGYGKVCVVNLKTGDVVERPLGQKDSPSETGAMAFDASGQLWVFFGVSVLPETWHVARFTARDWLALPERPLGFTVSRVALSRDRRRIALSSAFDELRLFTFESLQGQRIPESPVLKASDTVTRLQFALDDTWLTVAGDGSYEAWSVREGETPQRIWIEQAPHVRRSVLAVEPEGRRMAYASDAGQLRVVRLPDMAEQAVLDDAKDLLALSFSRAGALAGIDVNGQIHTWASGDRKIGSYRSTSLPGPSPLRLVQQASFNGMEPLPFDHGGRRLFVVQSPMSARSSWATQIHLDTQQPVARMPLDGEAPTVLPTASGVVVVGDGRLRHWGEINRHDATLHARGAVGHAAISRGGDRALLHMVPNSLASWFRGSLELWQLGAPAATFRVAGDRLPIAMRFGLPAEPDRLDVAVSNKPDTPTTEGLGPAAASRPSVPEPDLLLRISSGASPLQPVVAEAFAATPRTCDRQVAFAEDTDAFATGSWPRDVTITRAGQARPLDARTWPNQCIEQLWVDATARWLAAVQKANPIGGESLVIRDLSTGRELPRRPVKLARYGRGSPLLGAAGVLWMTLDTAVKDGRVGKRLEVLDLPSGRTVMARDLDDGLEPLCLSRSARLAALTGEELLRVYRVTAGGAFVPVARLSLPADAVACRFSPDESRLTYATSEGLRTLLLDPKALLAQARETFKGPTATQPARNDAK